MKEVKLQEICRIEKGKQIDTSQLSTDSPYKYINGGIKESGYYHEYNTDSEAVLVSEGGASCGYVNYVNEKFWCGCHCYKLTESKTLAKYLYYALKGNQDKIMELRSGAAMPNIKKEVFKNMSLLVDFDKNNQQAIVETLDCIQKAINNKADELLSLDELVKSRFIEMFGDVVRNDKKWETHIITKVCPIKQYDGTLSQVNNKYWLLNLDLIESNTGTILDKYYADKKEIGNSTITFSENNVLYSKLRPYLNKVVLPDGNGYATSELIPFLPLEKINKYYLAYALRSDSFVTLVNSKAGGAKMPRAPMDFIRSFPLPVPPISLQNEFAEFVKLIDKSKFIVQQQIKDLQELLDSKMDEYFR